jgi:hypothetical protein
VDFFRLHYGPTLRAFEALNGEGEALRADFGARVERGLAEGDLRVGLGERLPVVEDAVLDVEAVLLAEVGERHVEAASTYFFAGSTGGRLFRFAGFPSYQPMYRW